MYPDATYVGLADGAKANWGYLKHHTTVQILDFYHAAEYIGQAAFAAHPRDLAEREHWTETRCHDLKHKQGAATRLLKEMEALRSPQLSESIAQRPRASHHLLSQPQTSDALRPLPRAGASHRLGCHRSRLQDLSQATSVLPGMKWVERGARIVLSLRALVLTNERWQQFWDKINQYGFAIPAPI